MRLWTNAELAAGALLVVALVAAALWIGAGFLAGAVLWLGVLAVAAWARFRADRSRD
jgi:hypothetical protein